MSAGLDWEHWDGTRGARIGESIKESLKKFDFFQRISSLGRNGDSLVQKQGCKESKERSGEIVQSQPHCYHVRARGADDIARRLEIENPSHGNPDRDTRASHADRIRDLLLGEIESPNPP